MFRRMAEHDERMKRISREVRTTAGPKTKKKGRQKDLGGNIVSASDVEEDRAHIEFTQITLKTDKFTLKTKVETIRGMSPAQLQGHVRKRMPVALWFHGTVSSRRTTRSLVVGQALLGLRSRAAR